MVDAAMRIRRVVFEGEVRPTGFFKTNLTDKPVNFCELSVKTKGIIPLGAGGDIIAVVSEGDMLVAGTERCRRTIKQASPFIREYNVRLVEPSEQDSISQAIRDQYPYWKHVTIQFWG